jgi:hypothetical protein
LEPIPGKLNETGLSVSDKVHVREIVVIWGIDWTLPGISPDRLPLRGGADISAATPRQRFTRTKSWRLNAPFRLSSPTPPSAI